MWTTTVPSPSMCGTMSGTRYDSFYELMPYEAIDEAEYERRRAAMKPFNPSLLSRYEREETELDLGDPECAGGACPIR